jgi:hypothetical protein
MAFPSKDKDNKNPMHPRYGFHPSGQQMAGNNQIDCILTDCSLTCAIEVYGYSCSDGNLNCLFPM